MVTEKSINRVSSYAVELTMTVDADSVKSKYQEELKKTAKEITLPGFRKGKAPVSLLENKYGSYIKQDVIADVVDEAFESVVKDLDVKDKPLPYAKASFKDESVLENHNLEEPLTLTVVYEATPVFSLPAYTGLSVEYVSGEVSDEDIERRIEALRDQNALVVAKDGAVETGDIVTCNYVEVKEDGSEIEETKREDFTFTIGSTYNMYKLDDHLTGLKKGDAIVLTELKDADGKSTLTDPEASGLKVEITEVKHRELPEVDDEFAEDVKEEYKTVDDLKAGIRAEFEEHLSSDIDAVKRYNILKAILKNCEFDVPPSMIRAEAENRFRDQIRQSGLTEEQILSYYKLSGMEKEDILDEIGRGCELSLKQQLVLEAIREKEAFEATEEEISNMISSYINDDTSEETKEYYTELAKDEISFSKVMPYLLENNTFTVSKTLSLTDYEKYVNEGETEEAEESEESAEETNSEGV